MEAFTQFLTEYGLFLAKAVTVVVAIVVVTAWIAGTAQQLRRQAREGLEVTHINDRLDKMADTLYRHMHDKYERKARAKHKKAERKRRAKAAKLGKSQPSSRLFVVDFDGDIRASAVTNLREEISAILQVARPEDEVLLRLESAGGMVHSYGLAASQLRRLRESGIKLTAAVDKLAASGGYMMACVADRIVAAPFAIIGSIGVVGQLPNFSRLLKDKHIDYELHTAGDHKRTLTLFGENTEEGRAKFREELEATHGLFKQFVADNRAELDIDKVATGEHWHGTRALELKLVDEIKTSDDLLLAAASAERAIYKVHYKTRPGLMERLGESASAGIRRATAGWLVR